TSIQGSFGRPLPSLRMNACLSNKVMFLTWALDDIRCLDQMVWQHIAPRLFPSLQATLDDSIESANKNGSDTLADRIDDIFDRFAQKQLTLPPFESKPWQPWLRKKLDEL